jgi:guanylate kinase
LERRLRGRGTDPDEVIQVRLRNARAELAAAELGNFRYRLVNDDFRQARDELIGILRTELG